jgi:chemotaxis protein MotA
MSLPTLFGFLFGIALFVGSIILSTDNYMVFLELAGVIMVVGGTLAATFVAYEPRYVILALKLMVYPDSVGCRKGACVLIREGFKSAS